MREPFAFTLAALACVALLAGCQRRHEEAASPPQPATGSAAATPRSEPAQAPAPPPAAAQRIPHDAITDSVITARIKAGILSDPGMAGSDVSVNTDRGVVSLTGIIKSQEQAAIASAHAQRQDGVMRVDNQLAVNLQ